MAKGIVRRLWNRAAAAPRRIVLPEGEDPRTARAARLLLDEGVASEVTVLGDKDRVEQAFRDARASNDRVVGVDPRFDPRRPAYAAAMVERRKGRGFDQAMAEEAMQKPLYFGDAMVYAGDADGCVAGAVHTTGDVIRAALHVIGTAPGIKTVSGAFLMEVPNYMGTGEPKCFVYADSGVVPDPTAAQLADIAVASAELYEVLVGDLARVAMLSFSTKGSAEHPRVDKVREALALAKETLAERVDGELQADAALVPAIGLRKCPESPVAGHANVLVFPDLDSGNIAYKLTQRLARATAIGPLLQGLALPCHDLSRGASPEDIATASAIAVLQAGARNRGD